jgi:hypothetical protein
MQAAPDNAAPAIFILLLAIPFFLLVMVQLACQIMVIVKMFQKGETTLGTVCAILSFCSGIGGVIAFVYGWIKSSEWGLKTVMIAWTACLVLSMLLVVALLLVGALSIPVDARAMQH